jgi:farnesol dehydrogenase
MRILLTGGTGFLGGRIAARLAQDGHQVRALVRPRPRPVPMPAGVETVAGDVADLASMRRAAEGAETIVHGAALVRMWVRRREAFDLTNIGGLRNAIEVARRSPGCRLLHVSSFIALGPTDGTVGDEGLIHPGGARNDYERTKAAADRMARRAAADGVPIVIVYPGAIYGGGTLTDGSIITRLVRDFMNKRARYLGEGRQRVCYAFIDDVVDGIALALERGASGRGYILGGENADYRELFALLARLTQVPAPRRSVPFWLAEAAGKLLRWRAQLTGLMPILTDEVVRIYRHDWAFSSERAVAELGYRITPLEEGLGRTIAWLKEQKQ